MDPVVKCVPELDLVWGADPGIVGEVDEVVEVGVNGSGFSSFGGNGSGGGSTSGSTRAFQEPLHLHT